MSSLVCLVNTSMLHKEHFKGGLVLALSKKRQFNDHNFEQRFVCLTVALQSKLHICAAKHFTYFEIN